MGSAPCPFLGAPCALCGDGVGNCALSADVPEGVTPAQALALRLYGTCSPPRVSTEQLYDAKTTRTAHRLTVGSEEDYRRAWMVSTDAHTAPVVVRVYPSARGPLSARERVEEWAVCYVGEVEVRRLLRYVETARPTIPCSVCGLRLRRRVHARRLTPCPHTPE